MSDEKTKDPFDEIEERTFKIDKLWYDGEGDLLDTAEGRAKFCRLAETSIFSKPDPAFFNSSIWVYNVQGESLVIKKRSTVDPTLYECVEYNADGGEIQKFYDPA
jgi:hypothetical protein